MVKYYLDTCIWMDYFENRKDRFRPLGEWAFRLIKKVIDEEHRIVISDLVWLELRKYYESKKLEEIMSFIPTELMLEINISDKHKKKALWLRKKCNIPMNDALHIIAAREANAIFVTRDAHFLGIDENVKKPEELI